MTELLKKWRINKELSLWHIIAIIGVIISVLAYGSDVVHQTEINTRDIAYNIEIMNKRFDNVDKRFDKMTAKFDRLENKLDKVLDLAIKNSSK